MNTVIGVDIGTTTISVNLIEVETGAVVRSATYLNDSNIPSSDGFSDLQDPDKIYMIVLNALEDMMCEYSVSAIGITGQMHGIVYIDKNGNAVSPLYTWRDACGNEVCTKYGSDKSYCAVLSEITGYAMASGFGCTTFYNHTLTNSIPAEATCFCTIQDYVVIRLVNKNTPIMHVSNAASLGLFDVDKMRFDTSACEKAGLDITFLPDVTKENVVVGYYEETIPVSVAIGDNQASFLGSVRDMENSVLINIGTGSQISFMTKNKNVSPSMELRPLAEDYMIHAGSSLCGGRALAILEQFFRQIAQIVTNKPVQSAYPGIDACIEHILNKSSCCENKTNLEVSTKFCGTRVNPEERGSITNISIDNLSPENMIIGFLNGAINELMEMYATEGINHKIMVGSGNGLRKNDLLKKILEDKFGMKLCIPVHNEEAAYGAALFSLVCSGFCKNICEAQKLIVYEK